METKSQGHSARGKLFTDFVFQFFEVYGLLYEQGEKIAGSESQAPSEWQVLGAIEQAPLTMSQIGRRMGMTRQGVRRIANKLLTQGLIHNVPNQDHQTAALLELTDLGRAKLENMNSKQVGWANQVGQAFSQEALETTIQFMAKMIQVLEPV